MRLPPCGQGLHLPLEVASLGCLDRTSCLLVPEVAILEYRYQARE
jgi:hypothetical protein